MLDFGASFHVTSDQSQLVACKLVADGVSIQSADSASCPITHQGSLSNLMDKSHVWSLWGCTAHMVLVAVFLLLGQHLILEDSRTAS